MKRQSPRPAAISASSSASAWLDSDLADEPSPAFLTIILIGLRRNAEEGLAVAVPPPRRILAVREAAVRSPASLPRTEASEKASWKRRIPYFASNSAKGMREGNPDRRMRTISSTPEY
eukprot:scaffold137695_cov27-Tisochrysis_lutea.AAC.8